MKFSPFVRELLESQCGRRIQLSSDCDFLACDIESKTGEHIGVNTIKRLMGFIADERQPRESTVDIIAHYLGFDDWQAVRLHVESCSNSSFDARGECLAGNLNVGQRLLITYPPNRKLTIEYLGDSRFKVIGSENGKLLVGDVLTLTHIVRQYPLLVSDVVREGVHLGAFTAGKAEGIDFKLI